MERNRKEAFGGLHPLKILKQNDKNNKKNIAKKMRELDHAAVVRGAEGKKIRQFNVFSTPEG